MRSYGSNKSNNLIKFRRNDPMVATVPITIGINPLKKDANPTRTLYLFILPSVSLVAIHIKPIYFYYQHSIFYH